MPRNFKLTWQPGSGKRPGRWRKKHLGKVYYFDGGRGKHDREAYESALTAWETLKVELDAKAPKRHQAHYDREIARWEAVLAWCRQHDDQSMLETAVAKLSKLRGRLTAPKPRPVRLEDTFDGQFELRVRDPELHQLQTTIGELVENASQAFEPDPGTSFGERFLAAREELSKIGLGISEGGSEVIDPSGFDLDAADSLRREREVWEDRLSVARQRTASDNSAASLSSQFLDQKRVAMEAKELSPGRYDTIRRYVGEFVEWFGGTRPVTEINGRVLSDYHTELLERTECNGWSKSTTKDRLDTTKSFVNWLWDIDALPVPPRNMARASGSLKITKSSKPVVIFKTSEITKLLSEASDRTRLYVLLMLNCGMTQKDIADLHHGEVDWERGRIQRKRSKTRQYGSVPEVSYLLWPETQSLLQQFSTTSDGRNRVLLNENGEPLCRDGIAPDGKRKKNDNIDSAFDRLQAKAGIKKPLKSLKKTSATLIRGNAKYASLEHLFLGHAPRSMSDRHYTLPPQELLDEAVMWLAGEYGLAEVPEAAAQ